MSETEELKELLVEFEELEIPESETSGVTYSFDVWLNSGDPKTYEVLYVRDFINESQQYMLMPTAMYKGKMLVAETYKYENIEPIKLFAFIHKVQFVLEKGKIAPSVVIRGVLR